MLDFPSQPCCHYSRIRAKQGYNVCNWPNLAVLKVNKGRVICLCADTEWGLHDLVTCPLVALLKFILWVKDLWPTQHNWCIGQLSSRASGLEFWITLVRVATNYGEFADSKEALHMRPNTKHQHHSQHLMDACSQHCLLTSQIWILTHDLHVTKLSGSVWWVMWFISWVK